MKKLIIALLSLISVASYAQLDQQQDTLFIHLENGNTVQYLTFNNIDYTDAQKIGISTYDSSWNPCVETYNRSAIKSIEFRNRYSSPGALLQQMRFGAYDGLFWPISSPTSTYYMYACLASDEMLGGGGYYDEEFHKLDFMMAPRDAYSFWNYRYEWISNINSILELADQMPTSVGPATVAHTKGEALFMRAFYYYELASMFGNVPMITHNGSWEERIKSTTPEDVWGQIILDLKNAMKLMDGALSPTLRIDDGRVGKYAAEALLARCYLFYAGFYKGVNDISKADVEMTLPDGSVINKTDVIAALDDCISNSGFSLVDDYRNLWPYTNRLTVGDYPYTAGQGLSWVENDGAVNPEVLFKIKFNQKASWSTTIGYANLYALYFGMVDGGEDSFPFGIGWGAGPVSAKFYDEWKDKEPQDVRRDASIQYVYDLPNYNTPYGVEQFTPYHEKKMSPIMARNPYSSGSYWHCFESGMYPDGWESGNEDNLQLSNIHSLNLIRFADVQLMHSELTGTVTGINKVRNRAGLPALTEYSLEALQNERRWELAFEGVRWGDMRRWGSDYCKSALDNQQQTVYSGALGNCTTPTDLALSGGKTYSQLYDINHGFAAAPVDLETPCAEVISDASGYWTFGDINGICYGTMKYRQTDINAFLADPAASGIVKGYTLDELREQMPSLKSELSPFARILIDGNNIKKYDVNGNLMTSGNITYTETNDYDWRICHISLTEPALLGCVSVTGGSPKEFDLVMLNRNQTSTDGDKMILVESGKAEGDEVTFWVFSPQAMVADFMTQYVGNRKWSYTSYNAYDYYSGKKLNIGTWGIGSFNHSGPSYPGLYIPLVETTFPVDLKSKLESMGVSDTREADPFAYMQFDLVENTLSKYTADGTLIAKGDISDLHAYVDNIYFKVSNNAMLIPYTYSGKGETINSFRMAITTMTSGTGSQNPSISIASYTNDEMTTQWLFSPRGFKTEELADAIDVKQYDTNGNETVNGRYLKIFVGGAQFIQDKIAVTTDTPGISISYGGANYLVSNASYEPKTVELCISLTNDNGIVSTATKTITVEGRPAPTAEELLFAGNDDKQWVWDFDMTAWGNCGYQAGDDWSTSNNGQWWGVTSEAEFLEEGKHACGNPYSSDEFKASSYMQFTLDGKINSYNDVGDVLRSGIWSLGKDWVNGCERNVLYTTAGSILFPFAVNSDGYMPTRFEIMHLSDNSLALVYAKDGTGSWSEATFWRFKKKSTR